MGERITDQTEEREIRDETTGTTRALLHVLLRNRMQNMARSTAVVVKQKLENKFAVQTWKTSHVV